MTDPVNRPAHYVLPDGTECIDVMVPTQGAGAVEGWCMCNAWKYLWRHRYKGGDEDVKKAYRSLGMYLGLRGYVVDPTVDEPDGDRG